MLSVVLKRGVTPSLLATMRLDALVHRAPVSTVSLANPNEYSRQPEVRREALECVVNYSVGAGVDDGGAVTVQIAGEFHFNQSGEQPYEHLTGATYDANGNRIYWYRMSDGTFWDRLHFPRNTLANKDLWEVKKDYVAISREDFEKKRAPSL